MTRLKQPMRHISNVANNSIILAKLHIPPWEHSISNCIAQSGGKSRRILEYLQENSPISFNPNMIHCCGERKFKDRFSEPRPLRMHNEPIHNFIPQYRASINLVPLQNIMPYSSRVWACKEKMMMGFNAPITTQDTWCIRNYSISIAYLWYSFWTAWPTTKWRPNKEHAC